MKDTDLRLYCYVCGKTLGNDFCLMTMKQETDRVFLCCADDVEQVEDESIVVPIVRRPR